MILLKVENMNVGKSKNPENGRKNHYFSQIIELPNGIDYY